MLISVCRVPVQVPVTWTSTESNVERAKLAAEFAVGVPVMKFWAFAKAVVVEAVSWTVTFWVAGSESEGIAVTWVFWVPFVWFVIIVLWSALVAAPVGREIVPEILLMFHVPLCVARMFESFETVTRGIPAPEAPVPVTTFEPPN